MSRLLSLKLFVSERLKSAVEEIFEHFERAITECEEELERRHRERPPDVGVCATKLQHAAFARVQTDDRQHPGISLNEGFTAVQQLLLPAEDVSGAGANPEPPCIKEEQEEPWSGPRGAQLHRLEEADVAEFTFSPDPLKNEGDEENRHLFSSYQDQTGDAEAVLVDPQNQRAQKITDDYAGSQLAGSQPDMDDKTSEAGDTDTENSEDWSKQGPKSDRDKRTFICSSCDKRFCHKRNLKRHMRIHTGEKRFACSVCKKRFVCSGALSTHMRIHTGEKPFSCSFCSKQFRQQSHLVSHYRIHTGEKPFSCSVCGKRFQQNSRLKKHTRVHTAEKPFACSICGKRFGQRSNLVVHFRIHTGEQPFSCTVCAKSFRYRGELNRHMRVHAVNEPE